MRERRYPHKISAVYLNATAAAMSIILAFFVLGAPHTWLSYYVICTSIITVIAFLLKRRLIKIREGDSSGSGNTESHKRAFGRKIAGIFLVLAACFFIPLLAAGILNPFIWFMLLVSFISGISISEVVLYLYMR